VLTKVEAAVPERLRRAFARPEWHVSRSLRREARRNLETLRRAIDGRQKLRFRYRDELERASERTVRPLCLAFWGPTWTAGAWCELRNAFRNFRPDRMSAVELLAEPFEDEPGKDLAAYLRSVEEELAREGAPRQRAKPS
jgi:predicted DNA-binding transcriptional regulator YafY